MADKEPSPDWSMRKAIEDALARLELIGLPQEGLPPHWVLDQDNRPVRVHLMEWATWYENTQDRTVALTELHTPGRTLIVSTVFLGIDHGFGAPGGPVLFESMVLTEDNEGLDQERYRTWDEATAGHERMVARTKARYTGVVQE